MFIFKNTETTFFVTKVLNSNRKTGFIMIVGLKNAISLCEFIIKKSYMTYILTYKLSQDHNEITFSAIRSRGGYNINPICRQFAASYKRILVHNQMVGSIYGNCTILDSTKNLALTSTTETNTEQNNEHMMDHDYFDTLNVGNFNENVSFYIAGFVARAIAIKKLSVKTVAIFSFQIKPIRQHTHSFSI